MLDNFLEKFTTAFLGDAERPMRLILLKRAEWKNFAPNLYTGIGGEFEEGETAVQCIERELFEETKIKDVSLTEFGRINVNNQKIICQFFGVYNSDILPECTEGLIEKVPVSEVLDRDLIPTVRFFFEEWKKRDWKIDTPFTVFVERTDLQDVYARVISKTIKDGLQG